MSSPRVDAQLNPFLSMCVSVPNPQIEPHTGKKTVLVTGGAGFIGSWVADSLLARGDDVVIVDEVKKGCCCVGVYYSCVQERWCDIFRIFYPFFRSAVPYDFIIVIIQYL